MTPAGSVVVPHTPRISDSNHRDQDVGQKHIALLTTTFEILRPDTVVGGRCPQPGPKAMTMRVHVVLLD